MANQHAMNGDARRAIVGTTIPFVLATFGATLRFISRRSSQNLGLDDWCCLFAYLAFVALYTCSMVWIASGTLQTPLAEVGLDGIETFLKFGFAAEILYTLVCPAVKLSFLLFYSRIFDTRPFRWSLVAVVTAIMLWFFASFFATILQCQPVQAFWIIPDHFTHCTDGRKLLLGTSSTNVVLNLVVVVMPIPIVWKLDPSMAQKIILFVMLCLGLLITVFSILRTYYVAQIGSIDVNMSLVDVAIWTTVEPGMTIFCACLPSFPHLIAMYHDRAKAKKAPKFNMLESRVSLNEQRQRYSIFGRYSSELQDTEKTRALSSDHDRDDENESSENHFVNIALPDRVQSRSEPLPPTQYAGQKRDTRRWSRRGITVAAKQFIIHS